MIEALDQVLAKTHFAITHPGRHCRIKLLLAVAIIIEDDKTLHADPLCQQGALQQRQPIRPFRQGAGIVLGDQAAQGDAGLGVEQR
ncbi:hypothetical protein D3C80_1721830 [compost metagenome]